MLPKLSPVALGLLRLFAAFMFFQFGAQKVFGLFGSDAAAPFSVSWISGAIELLGSLAIAAGWLTRPFAVLLAIDMAGVYIFQHAAQGTFLPISRNRTTEEIGQLLTIAGLLVFSGPGKFSVEGRRPHSLSKYYPDAFAVFRILTGLMFMSHGLVKLFGIGGRQEVFLSFRWFAGILEFGGGAAITLGLFTAPVAFIVSGEMAVAYFMSHGPNNFWPIENNGMRAVLFCYTFLFFFTVGSGKFSLDSLLRGKKSHIETHEPIRV
jgi:putative oxidoreductase